MKLTLTDIEIRVIGALLEKEVTTPEQYPLSLNSLLLACNQKSNREPVMNLTQGELESTLNLLDSKNLIFKDEHRSRVTKYKHRFCNTQFNSLQFNEEQKAIICVLFLRGAQTTGELRTRTQRLADLRDVSDVEACLASLQNHDGECFVKALPKEAGKRECRYIHLLSDSPNEEIEEQCQDSSDVNHHESKVTTLISVSNDLDKSYPSNKSPTSSDTEILELKQRISALEETVLDLQTTIEDMKAR